MNPLTIMPPQMTIYNPEGLLGLALCLIAVGVVGMLGHRW